MNLKKYCIICLLVLPAGILYAQKNRNIPDPDRMWQTYQIAMAFADLQEAKTALFHIIAADQENRAVYDTLAHIYFQMGAYQQAIQASDSAITNTGLQEIKAFSLRNLGDVKPALPLFESLFAQNGSPQNGYQVATLQFSLKRFGECQETIKRVAAHPDSKSLKVLISTEQGENMQVSYLAATENLKGVLNMELGKFDEARICFEKALEEAPDFTLAKTNLGKLKNPEKQ